MGVVVRSAGPRRAVVALLLASGLLALPASAGTGAAATAPSTGRGELSAPLQSLADTDGKGPSGTPQVRPSGPADPDAEGPGTLIDTPDGVLVQVFSDDLTGALVDGLREAGATVVHSDQRYDIATVAAEPGDLEALAAVDGVRYVREVLEPLTSGMGAVFPNCGAAHTEGDAQLNADDLRTAWDVEGSGVEVGVLSDSWNRETSDSKSLAQDIASGDIPGATNPCPGPGRTALAQVLQEGPSDGADEGRAMAQIVHDLAPASEISFATAFLGDLSFADNIRALRTAGADVIVDDIFYFNEPEYQNGPIGVAAEDVVAQGSAYFSAIGNETITLGGNPVSSYEAQQFRATTCPSGVPAGVCHDFNPTATTDNTFRVTVPNGGELSLSLKWDEPWEGVATDYDLYFLVAGSVVNSSLDNNISGTEQPFEYASSTISGGAKNVDVVVRRKAGAGTPRFKLGHIRSDLTASEYTSSNGGDIIGPNSGGHAAVPNGVGVGAVPYNNANAVEGFSNRGPATWYWGPVVGSTPAAHLAAPLVLNKPDVAATDGGRTTFFYDPTGTNPAPRFFGTSASAPHAAAVAALLLDCNPSLTPAQITDALTDTASPVSGGVPANVGAGLVNALAAGNAVCDPPVDEPTFSVSDASVTEGNGAPANTLTFTVTLSEALPTASSVSYATANVTAVAPGDYTAKALTALPFAAGETSKTVSVTVIGDTAVEPNETLSLVLSSPSGAVIGDGTGTGTILNDDVPSGPSVSVADVSGLEGTTATKNLTFSAVLSAPAPGPVSVQYQTVDGTAVAPGDYTAIPPTTLTFASGETSKVFRVILKRDAVVEPDETLSVLLSNPIGLTIADGTAIGTVVNDDGGPIVPAVTLADASGAEGSGSPAQTLTFTASLSAPAPGPISVQYQTANGTAVAPGDFTALPLTTLSFATGETSKPVTVTLAADAAVEPDEMFTLSLSNPVGMTIADGSAIGTILNDDAAAVPAISVGDVSGAEGSGVSAQTLTFTASLSAPAPGPISVQYQTANGTAVAPGDYAALPLTTLSFTAGQTAKTVTVNLAPDDAVEPDETMFLLLTNPVGMTLADGSAIGTILNDDVPAGVPAATVADVVATEGTRTTGGSITFTVQLSAPAPGTVSVAYQTGNGSAVAPGDYAAASGVLTFTAGQTSKTVTISLVRDAVVEPDETFFLLLTNPVGVTLGDGSAIGTIQNDD